MSEESHSQAFRIFHAVADVLREPGKCNWPTCIERTPSGIEIPVKLCDKPRLPDEPFCEEHISHKAEVSSAFDALIKQLWKDGVLGDVPDPFPEGLPRNE